MFLFRKSKRVEPPTKRRSKAVSFLSPHTTAASDPAHMSILGSGQPKQFTADLDELLSSTSSSKTKDHQDGAGDFTRTKASHYQPKKGSAFKRLFKSQRVVHQHQQTVSEPPHETEPKSADKEGKSHRRMFHKPKSRKKHIKSAEMDGQEAQQELDVEAEQSETKSVHASLEHSSLWSNILDQNQKFDDNIVLTSSPDILPNFSDVEKNYFDTEKKAKNSMKTAIESSGKDLCEIKPGEIFKNTKEKAKKSSFQTINFRQGGNTVTEYNSPGPLQRHVGSVETVKGNADTSSSYNQFYRFKKNIFFFDMDPSLKENKQQSNADPAVGAEKPYISGDTGTESMPPSYRISAKSPGTDQRLRNKQDGDLEGPEHISFKTMRSITEASSYSDLFLSPLETLRQIIPPNQPRRSLSELSLKHFSDSFEKRVYGCYLEVYLNSCLRQWKEMKQKRSSESATESLKEPTSSAEGWEETVTERLSSQPDAHPTNVRSIRSRFKRFTNLVQERLSQLLKIRIVVTIYR
ncbi:uncharacterized protein LOC129367091 [Poeciliopsis prolifica]|uniref:uncharacterized protein LOC129367091 n=1 Tax=Poeciliopsis prolifica TaxID=188132 RepID=UPI002413B586|nr:uncharacterized protein LOC129367091 [Poeciliopsis prolifica]